MDTSGEHRATIEVRPGASVRLWLGLKAGRTVTESLPHSAVTGSATAAIALSIEHAYHRLVRVRIEAKRQELEQGRTRVAALESRWASLESRLRPHFLFNTLSSIRELLLHGFGLIERLDRCSVCDLHHGLRRARGARVRCELDRLPAEAGDAHRLPPALDRLEERLRQPASETLAELIGRVRPLLGVGAWLRRVGSQSGEGFRLIDVAEVTHFVSEDRISYACTERGRFPLTASLTELDSRLDPAQFLRVHRSAIVNLRFVEQIGRWFGGRLAIRLNDQARTEVVVSRDRVEPLRKALGL